MKENCQQLYIGETKKILKAKLAHHCGYLSNGNTSKATGANFNMPWYNLADLRVTVLEPTRGNNTEYRKEREHYVIRQLDTYHKKHVWLRVVSVDI